jgi:hypothetical protein
MYELIYMSSATKKLSEEEIHLLLFQARHYNIGNGITGVLLYIEGDFLQVLEGQKKVVESLFENIKRDKRHKGIIVVYENEKSKRQFPDWSMGFHSSTYEMLQKLPGFEDINSRELLNIEDKTAVSFIETFIKTHKEKVSFW